MVEAEDYIAAESTERNHSVRLFAADLAQYSFADLFRGSVRRYLRQDVYKLSRSGTIVVHASYSCGAFSRAARESCCGKRYDCEGMFHVVWARCAYVIFVPYVIYVVYVAQNYKNSLRVQNCASV